MISLRCLVLFALFLRSAVRRFMRTDDFHQHAHQLSNRLIESLEGTADARESFLLGDFGKRVFHVDRPSAVALYGAQGDAPAFPAPHGQVIATKRGGPGALFGPRRARVTLQAASGPEKERVRDENLARAEAIRKAYYERNPAKAPKKEKEVSVRKAQLAAAEQFRKAEEIRKSYYERNPEKAPKEEKEDSVRSEKLSTPEETRKAYYERNPEKLPKEKLESKPQAVQRSVDAEGGRRSGGFFTDAAGERRPFARPGPPPIIGAENALKRAIGADIKNMQPDEAVAFLAFLRRSVNEASAAGMRESNPSLKKAKQLLAMWERSAGRSEDEAEPDPLDRKLDALFSGEFVVPELDDEDIW